MTKLGELRKLKHDEAKAYSQTALAKVAGVSLTTYRKIEDGERGVTQEQAKKLADHLGVKPRDIFLNRDVTFS